MASSKPRKNLAGQIIPARAGVKKPHRYHHIAHDPKRLIARYRRAAKGLPIDDILDTITHYKGRTKTETELMPGTWGNVLLMAVITALTINTIKICVYESIGKPSWISAREAQILEEKMEETSGDSFEKHPNEVFNIHNNKRKFAQEGFTTKVRQSSNMIQPAPSSQQAT